MKNFFIVLALWATNSYSEITIKENQKAIPPSGLKAVDFWKGLPGNVKKGIVRQKGLYEFESHHDEKGFRIPSHSSKEKNPQKHIFLAGGSSVYGEGLKHEDTFSHFIEDSKYKIINMGIQNGSIPDALFIWKYYYWNTSNIPKEGFFIFTYEDIQDDSIDRIKNFKESAKENSPYFTEETGSISFAGYIKDLPKKKNEKQFIEPSDKRTSNTVRYLKEIRKEYLKQFPTGRFVVSWMTPVNVTRGADAYKRIFAELNKEKIEVWSDFNKVEGDSRSYQISNSELPNLKKNQRYANLLKSKINEEQTPHSSQK